MAYKGFRSLERSKPPVNELVELQHLTTGIGAPEREGWVSVGRMRENGSFSIKQNTSGTVDFRPPTHWKALTLKKYNIIYADPAWGFNKGVYQDKGRNERLINQQYKTMSEKQLLDLPINNLAEKDAACFLWVTDSHLKKGIALMEAWGFTYRTIVFIWKKVTKNGKTCANVGAWTMKNCEVCIFGARGNMLQHKKANNVFQLIEAERTKHSKKPLEAIERIETLFGDLPRIELFCRYPQDGWSAWGNEVENSVDLSQYYS